MINRNRPNSGKTRDSSESNSVRNALSAIKSQDPQNMQALAAFERELESTRTTYLNSWSESATRLQDELRRLKCEVQSDFRMEMRDAEYYRVNMFQMEAKISEMKENVKNELCSLLKEESELNKELALSERRVEDWGKPLNSKIFKPTLNSTYKIHSQEVKSDPLGEFQKFLSSSGGHYGGWEEQDHLLFLRERRKYSGKPKFMSALHSIIPDISLEEIEAHEDWYRKYELLKGLQKEAIRKWRASRSSVSEDVVVTASHDHKEESNRIKSIAYQRDIAERIKEWRRQQELRKAEQEEREKREEESRAEERHRKREAQKAKKLAVEQYKAEKISRIQSELMASQKVKELQSIEEKARKSLLLKAFREQDQQYIERIKSLRSKSAASKVRDSGLESVKPSIEIVVERDRRRLLQPTQVWNQHCLHHDADKSGNKGNTILEKRSQQYIERFKDTCFKLIELDLGSIQ